MSLFKRLLFITFPYVVVSLEYYCWKHGSNPFNGPPTVERLSSDRVRIDWTHIFDKNERCDDVDFIIRSNPRNSPSDYQLSEFLPKGQTTATLVIDDGKDFVFQIVVREDKGSDLGIEYKYSQMVTSYASDISNGSMPLSNNNENDEGDGDESSSSSEEDSGETCDIITSIPLLRNISDPQIKTLLKDFVDFSSQRSLTLVRDFLRSKKPQSRIGYIVAENGIEKCCITPWKDKKCFQDFARCDGGCIPPDWISDGWSDCIDGKDESGILFRENPLPYHLLCIQCFGLISISSFLCNQDPNCIKGNYLAIKGSDCDVCLTFMTD